MGPAGPDADRDRFLGGGMFRPVTLGRGFNRVGGLESNYFLRIR